jgi:hypothetical protein
MGGYSGPGLGGATASAKAQTCGLRLTLESGVPVSSADQAGKTTLYLTPYVGGRIALYDGAASWVELDTAEVSIACGALAHAAKPYDVFAYNNSGAVALELLEWTSATARATALVRQNGVLVKSGATTRRYLGTIYVDGADGATTCQDTAAKRFVFNAQNRVARPLAVTDSTNTWTYTTATWRQARGSTANQVAWVQGLDEDPVSLTGIAWGGSSTGSNGASVGIGLDRTNNNDAVSHGGGGLFNVLTLPLHSSYRGRPGIGYHYAAWVEFSVASGTTTWYGVEGSTPPNFRSGLHGEVQA